MACRFEHVFTEPEQYCMEKSGGRTAMAMLPQVLDCSEETPGGGNSDCEDNWNNNLCGNDKPYFRPLAEGEPLVIQTNFVDTRNFGAGGQNCPDGIEPNRIRASFRIRFNGNWAQDTTRNANGQDLWFGAFHSFTGECPQNTNPAPGTSIGNQFSQLNINASNFSQFMERWIVPTQEYQGRCGATKPQIGFGVQWSWTSEGPNVGILQYEGNICDISDWIACVEEADLCVEENCCDCPSVADILERYIQPCFTFIASNGAASNSPFVFVGNLVTIEQLEYLACCNEPSECFGFGDADCEFDPNVALFRISIPDNPAYVFGAAAQELAEIRDTGFILELIAPRPCNQYTWDDVPPPLRFSNAADYNTYMSNVLGWAQALVAGWGSSSVVLNGDTFEFSLDRLYFEGTLGVNVCEGRFAICPLTGPQPPCVQKTDYRISFDVVRIPEPFISASQGQYWLECAGQQFFFYDADANPPATFYDWLSHINLNVPGARVSQAAKSYVGGVASLEFVIDLTQYPALAQCLANGGTITPRSTAPEFLYNENTVMDDGDGCENTCVQTIDGYKSYDILLTSYLGFLADDAANDYFYSGFELGLTCFDYSNPQASTGIFPPLVVQQPLAAGTVEQRVRDIVNDFNAYAYNHFGYGLFMQYLEQDRIRIYIPDTFFANFVCPCDSAANRVIPTLTTIQDYTGNGAYLDRRVEHHGITSYCCESDCNVPPDFSRLVISFTDTGYEYGNPNQDACFGLLPASANCNAANCEQANFVCLSDAANRFDFDRLAVRRLAAQFNSPAVHYNNGEYIVWASKEVAPCDSEWQLCLTSCSSLSGNQCANTTDKEIAFIFPVDLSSSTPGTLTIEGAGCDFSLEIPNFQPNDALISLSYSISAGLPPGVSQANVFTWPPPQGVPFARAGLRLYIDPTAHPELCDCTTFTGEHFEEGVFDLEVSYRDPCCDVPCYDNEDGFLTGYVPISFIGPFGSVDISQPTEVVLQMQCNNAEDGEAEAGAFGIYTPYPVAGAASVDEWWKNVLMVLNGPGGLPLGAYAARRGNSIAIKTPIAELDPACACAKYIGWRGEVYNV